MTHTQIKKARSDLGFTQQKMADTMGINIKLWQKWEYGSQGISAAPAKFLKVILILGRIGILNNILRDLNQ